jgi:hypothetical protein
MTRAAETRRDEEPKLSKAEKVCLRYVRETPGIQAADVPLAYRAFYRLEKLGLIEHRAGGWHEKNQS